MNKCSVYICESKTEYEGQYEFMNAGMEVEIFNYHAPSEENVSIGDEVKYKEITIVDLRNRVFVFSPVFYNVGVTYALTQYEKYKTDFYFTTGKVDSVDSFSCNMKMSTLKMYHPLLMQCFNNPALQVSCGESEMNYKVIKNSDKKVVEIQNNNIKKIEFGGKCTYSRKNNGQLITIEAENYATIYLDEPITYKDLLMYIKEFDVLVNAYCPSGLHSYATYITTIEGNHLFTKKAKGRLQNLKDLLKDENVLGHVGIGHTRWATHGIPSNLNSHPHTNNDETISLVHNGIIENYLKLKQKLEKKGYEFVSETDTEVLAHLLDYYYQGNPLQAITKVMHLFIP